MTDKVLEIAWNHPNDEFLRRVEELFCKLVGINLKSLIVDNASNLVGGALSKREDRLQTNDHQEVMKAKKNAKT